MKVNDILSILQKDMKAAVFATVDEEGKPHARYAHIGVANEQGIFFMTSPKTNFYQQLTHNQQVAITAMSQDDYLIQVIRIEGKVREIGRERLEEVLKDNPFVKHVYPTESDIAGVQVFHLYEGEGFYHSMTQGHKYVFKINEHASGAK
ncbi:pyridoxamine 5'-phosphate oxidase family protein [Tuanshanicoccus lijuaniae]|uniref:pyridoxamine 5'-phosphate oxidase family protein n=1 Tax=Aerococcaceae bacterium zg-1292 TaxID=2774330 RepID=UPI001BD8605A|nr:pyridoxamine 5'-phosphate oxidase family protein [Aerococcaceae bacterium zg-A91]MBS4458162.1 pyridoxamine 5'-phosphate oxidase family protein [Aerococcaceae bacterium zg-BR33]